MAKFSPAWNTHNGASPNSNSWKKLKNGYTYSKDDGLLVVSTTAPSLRLGSLCSFVCVGLELLFLIRFSPENRWFLKLPDLSQAMNSFTNFIG